VPISYIVEEVLIWYPDSAETHAMRLYPAEPKLPVTCVETHCMGLPEQSCNGLLSDS